MFSLVLCAFINVAHACCVVRVLFYLRCSFLAGMSKVLGSVDLVHDRVLYDQSEIACAIWFNSPVMNCHYEREREREETAKYITFFIKTNHHLLHPLPQVIFTFYFVRTLVPFLTPGSPANDYLPIHLSLSCQQPRPSRNPPNLTSCFCRRGYVK